MFKSEQLVQKCRENRLKVTPQRIAVYNMLAGNKTHPTVEQVFVEVRKNIKSISLDTVYRILNSFTQIGLIQRLSHGNAVRYDGNAMPHHHFSCECCNRIFDVELPDLKIENQQLHDIGEISSMELSFRGHCKECANKIF